MNVQDQTVATANDIFTVVQGLVTTLGTITRINNAYTEINMAAVLAALPTVAMNADGSLGTPDPAPVSGNPIDNSKISKLMFSMSAYDIGVMLTLLQQVSALLNGSTVAQQTTAPASMAKVTSE